MINPTYRKIGDTFALNIVKGDYSAALAMLAPSAWRQWNTESLNASYQDMIAYFDGAAVEVVTDWEEIGDVQLDHGVMIYVPVESAAGGEAITTVINPDGQIVDVEFGRP